MVQIIKAQKWGEENGFYKKESGWNNSTPTDIVLCSYNRAEYVIVADNEILEQIKALPNDSYLAIKIGTVTKWLKENNIFYEIIK